MPQTLLSWLRWRIRRVLAILAPLIRRRSDPLHAQAVLCIVSGGLGDLLMAMPLLRNLLVSFPHATLGVICTASGGELLVDEFPNIVYNAKKHPIKAIVYALRPWDHTIVSMMGFYSIFCDILSVMARGTAAIGPIATTQGTLSSIFTQTYQIRHGIHYTAVNMQAISAPHSNKPYPYPLKRRTQKHASQTNLPGVLIHIGSHREYTQKRWPVKNCIELITLINKSAFFSPTLLLGPDDYAIAESLETISIKQILPHSISELADAVSSFSYFIGTDSGPLHLAASLGVSVIGLFGPTDPIECSPVFSQGTILTANVTCCPCFSYNSPCNNAFKCMNNLSADLIYSALLTLYHGTNGSTPV
jgi:ADP-heptose:LPS heptosyltransferase